MECLVNLSLSRPDFAELDALFGPTSLISVFNAEGIFLAANQRALASYDLGSEAFGKHVDALFDGYQFERMHKLTFDKLLRTGIPATITDRVHPHRKYIIERMRTLMLRIPWEQGFAVLSVSHVVDDFLVEALRNYSPKTKLVSGTVSGIPMRWVDFETMYLAMRCSSTKEIATILRRSDDAVRLRLQALADYLEKTFSALGHSISVPSTLKAIQPFLRNWPINDAVLAGCISGLNAWHGKNTVSIAGFHPDRKLEEALRFDSLHGLSAAQLMLALVKEETR